MELNQTGGPKRSPSQEGVTSNLSNRAGRTKLSHSPVRSRYGRRSENNPQRNQDAILSILRCDLVSGSIVSPPRLVIGRGGGGGEDFVAVKLFSRSTSDFGAALAWYGYFSFADEKVLFVKTDL